MTDREEAARRGWKKRKQKVENEMKKVYHLKFTNGVLVATVVFMSLVTVFLFAFSITKSSQSLRMCEGLTKRIDGIEFVAEDLFLYQKIEDILITEGKEKLSADEIGICVKIIYRYHKKYANILGLDYARILAVVNIESKFNPKAVSHVGAIGLMQILPSTGKRLLSDYFNLNGLTMKQIKEYLFDSEYSLILGLELLLQHQQDYLVEDKANKKNWTLAHSRYNWSHRSVLALEKGTKEDPKASLAYALEIEKIIKRYYNWKVEK